MFLYSTKNPYLLTSKIALDINPLIHHVPKWSDTLKYLAANAAYFSKHACPFWDVIYQETNNYLQLLHAVQELRNSLHVRRNFWCLIMAPIKLM